MKNGYLYYSMNVKLKLIRMMMVVLGSREREREVCGTGRTL